MIHIVVGTKAQLIKMAPVMRRLADRGLPYHYIATGQHQDTMAEIHANFAIAPPHLRLYEGPEVRTIPQMLAFGARILARTVGRRAAVFRGDRDGIVLVHGDTFSTLLGALMARAAGLRVGHVESGLRSFDLTAPFPEELIRIATFHLADYYFCPGDWAVANLHRFRGCKVNTEANTLWDALRYAQPVLDADPGELGPPRPYGVVTIHRHENIRSAKALGRIVDAVKLIAERHRLLFVLHAPTEMKLRRFGRYAELAAHPNIILHGRYDYFDFMRLLTQAEFVVSDGGSNQEECSYLGKPVLLLREVTERQEGLDANVVVSRFDPALIRLFRDQYSRYARWPPAPTVSPSDTIIDACACFQ